MKVLFVLIFFLYIFLYLYFKELIYINFENLKLEEFVVIVSKILNKNITSNALISRLGGEEFCICFYNRSEKEILDLLEYIRNDFEVNIIKIANLELKYTVSIGCSFDFKNNIDEMINDADKYLYLAKNDGRNRVRSNENRFTQSYNIM